MLPLGHKSNSQGHKKRRGGISFSIPLHDKTTQTQRQRKRVFLGGKKSNNMNIHTKSTKKHISVTTPKTGYVNPFLPLSKTCWGKRQIFTICLTRYQRERGQDLVGNVGWSDPGFPSLQLLKEYRSGILLPAPKLWGLRQKCSLHHMKFCWEISSQKADWEKRQINVLMCTQGKIRVIAHSPGEREAYIPS